MTDKENDQQGQSRSGINLEGAFPNRMPAVTKTHMQLPALSTMQELLEEGRADSVSDMLYQRLQALNEAYRGTDFIRQSLQDNRDAVRGSEAWSITRYERTSVIGGKMRREKLEIAEIELPHLGDAYAAMRMGDEASARGILDHRADFLARNIGLTVNHVAEAFVAAGDPDSAIQAYADGLEVQPDNAEFQDKLEGLLVQQMADEADETRYLKPYAELLMSRGDYVSAEAVLEELMEMDGESPDALVMLGRAYVLSGDKVDAYSAFKQAVQIDPQNVKARSYLDYFESRKNIWRRDFE